MVKNKTVPTNVSVDDFLETVNTDRVQESRILIKMMSEISGELPIMWGPSIIGFGVQHYRYDTGREGDIGILGFSPRKANLTIYFNEGFDRYPKQLARLGSHSLGVSCLYVKKLTDIDIDVLRDMLTLSYQWATKQANKSTTVDEYLATVPKSAIPHLEQLRRTIKQTLPESQEVYSYGIIGYKIDDKRARVFIAGWDDHVSLYPIPKDERLQKELKSYTKGKGTLWFTNDAPLPTVLISRTVRSLVA